MLVSATMFLCLRKDRLKWELVLQHMQAQIWWAT